MLWKTSPAATELEECTLDWLRQMLGLPEVFHGVIMDTASIASMIAIAAAREALDLDIRRRGMLGRPELPRLRLYTSEEAHSSIRRRHDTRPRPGERTQDPHGCRVSPGRRGAGAGHRRGCGGRLATVPRRGHGRHHLDHLHRSVPEVVALCREYGLWPHVDGAYGGMAAIVPAYRSVLAGCAQADSFVTNPHKWLLTPIDCSAFYVRDPALLKRAFSLVPEYLVTGSDTVNNYMDWGVQLAGASGHSSLDGDPLLRSRGPRRS